MSSAARRRADVAALAALERQLRGGVRVADVRCGDGRALIDLANAYPISTFHGFGADPGRIASARRAAAAAGVSDRVTFEVTSRGAIEAEGYDLLVDSERVTRAIASRPIR